MTFFHKLTKGEYFMRDIFGRVKRPCWILMHAHTHNALIAFVDIGDARVCVSAGEKRQMNDGCWALN